jgi:DNA-directed RNA polymerase specialized sigma subunit
MYYYAKYTTIEGITIHRGMSKESLLELCKLRELDELETNILTMFYCDRWKLPRIAMKLKYSESSISRIKERALKKIRN